MGGNEISKPIDHQVGIGNVSEKSENTDSGKVWYYDISNFFLGIVCNLNYWNYFESCGPFNLSGCDQFNINSSFTYALANSGAGTWTFFLDPGFIKFSWVLIDIVCAFFILVIGTILGYFASELALIPEFLYDLFSLIEGLLAPLIEVFGDLFGDILTLFETGGTYILQFVGFTGDLAGQSLMGLGTDVADSISNGTGIPTVLVYILLAEVILQILLKLVEKYSANPSHWNCVTREIYSTLDTPFEWLTTTIFSKGLFHILLELLFSPFRILIWLVAIFFGTIFCDTIGSPMCQNIQC